MKPAERKRRERLVGLLLSVILIVGAIAPAVTAIATASGADGAATTSAAQGKHAKKKHKKAKKKKATKKKAKKKATKKKKAPAPAAAPSPPACAATPSAMDAASAAFLAHVRSAHLQKSVGEQVKDLAKTDEYIKLHTVWLETVIDPVIAALTGPALDAFLAHVRSAHLQKSPLEQVNDLKDVNGYVQLHTVWLETVLAPLIKGTDCPAQSTPAPSGPTAQNAAVMIMGNRYDPQAITVPVGSKVTWMNHDSDPHTVTSSGGGPLSSANLARGAQYSYTFSSPGTYAYYCAIHPQMTGSVTVR